MVILVADILICPVQRKRGTTSLLHETLNDTSENFLLPSQLNELVKFKVKVTVVNSESSWNPLTMMPTNAQITAESGNLTLTNKAHKSYSIGPKNT